MDHKFYKGSDFIMDFGLMVKRLAVGETSESLLAERRIIESDYDDVVALFNIKRIDDCNYRFVPGEGLDDYYLRILDLSIWRCSYSSVFRRICACLTMNFKFDELIWIANEFVKMIEGRGCRHVFFVTEK